MLRPGEGPSQIQKWYSRLAPLIASGRERLRGIAPPELARRSGCTVDPGGALRLACFGQEYLIPPLHPIPPLPPDWQEPSEFIQALLITYLVTADGTPPSGRWIAYRDLPGGMFYAQAFHGYAEVRLVRELEEEELNAEPQRHPRGRGLEQQRTQRPSPRGEGLAAFCRGAERIGGEPIAIGSAGYAFQALPRIRLAAAYWLGDEELSAQASILFEDTAPHYMSTDGLAVLGSHLVGAIVQAARLGSSVVG